MPNRITLSNHPSLQDSVRTVHEALDTGRTVAVNSQGSLEVRDITDVRGGTLFGRTVRYLKQCVFPDPVRQRNHAVIAALNDQIRGEFSNNQQLDIRTVLRRADTNQHFLQSIIDSVGNLRKSSKYTPAKGTEEEARSTLKFGFAGKVTAPRARYTVEQALQLSEEQTASSAGETPNAREQLFWYNRTMDDLYLRFPKLRDVPAIPILHLDIPFGRPTAAAKYNHANHSLKLAAVDPVLVSGKAVASSNDGFVTPKQDYGGFIHHEYAHHLSNRIVPEKVWVPKLVDALRAGGISNASIINYGGKPVFDQTTAGKIATSVSEYAATDPRECAAEILSWYMNPEYGKSVKRMPDYLENWVRDCFPMLKRA